MFFSYRTRRVLKRIFPILLAILILFLVAIICGLLWLQRFVIYTAQGVRFDFGLQPPASSGWVPQKQEKYPVFIEYFDEYPLTTQPPERPETPEIPSTPQEPVRTGVTGYYLEAKQVWEDPDGVRQQLEQLPAGTTVMIQLANFWGSRYYSSEYASKETSEENRQRIDDLIAWMTEKDLHIVGRMPAFRDYYFADNKANQSLILKKPNGYPWKDGDGTCWLDPSKEKVLTRVSQMIRELRSMGFDEVLLDDFFFPEFEEIDFSGDRIETIYQAAETLVVACATEEFTVSFVTADYDFRVPEGNCRLYVNAEPTEVQDVLAQIQVADKATQVVFFCNTYDDRFDGCSVIRPYALLQ